MTAAPATETRRRAPAYRLSRAEAERRGRWRSMWAAVIGLVILWGAEFPAWFAAQQRWAEYDPTLGPTVAARISVAIDVAIIPAYLLAAWRAVELTVAARSPRI